MQGCQGLYLAMEKRRVLRERLSQLRAQRWSREVLLAALLTLAAAVFIATAMVGREGSGPDKAPLETARKPAR
jgi:hypothetical protein